MLGALLGNFHGPVAEIDRLLGDAVHLVAEYQCVFFAFSHLKCGQSGGFFDLFDG